MTRPEAIKKLMEAFVIDALRPATEDDVRFCPSHYGDVYRPTPTVVDEIVGSISAMLLVSK